MLVVPVAAAGRLCVSAAVTHVCCTAEDDHSVSRRHDTIRQGCNGAHDEDPTDGAGVVKQVTDFILLLM